LYPGADPIGRRVRMGGPDGPWRTMVSDTNSVRMTTALPV
jgi:hypothetical protein